MITGAQSLIIFPSRSSRPRLPVCFSCSKALCTSYTVTGGIVRVDFEVFDSKKRFQKIQSFDFDLSFAVTESVTFAN